MSAPTPDASLPPNGLAPHADLARWDALIEEVGPAAVLVVIGSSMSKSLRAHCTAEDIWQETLADAWRSRDQHRWQGVGPYRAWLFQIARNRICDAARSIATEKRGAGRATARFSELESGFAHPVSGFLPPDSMTPSRVMMHAERAAAMRESLAALPAELEAIVRMHLLEGLTMEVVAERLGIGVSLAWHRFRKGSKLYSSRLAEWQDGRAGSRA